MNASKILILGAVGIAAYLLMTKSASAGQARPGTYSPIYPKGYGAPTAPNTPAGQLDALNNSTLYGVGRFINGIFGGNSGNVGGVPMGTQPSAMGIGSGGGAFRPSNDFGLGSAPTLYSPGTYSVDPNSWGPFEPTLYSPGTYSVDPNSWGPQQPDAYAVNTPGGYDISTAALYSNDMYGSWN